MKQDFFLMRHLVSYYTQLKYSTMKTLEKEEKREQKGEKGMWKMSLEKKSGLG